MSIPDKLKEHINNQDVMAIRIMLKNRITSDPTFKEFDELDNYINRKNVDIYEKYDGKAFEEDRTKWNKDYLNTECIRLVTNFSKERVNHLRKVCKVVYRERIYEIIGEQPNDGQKKSATAEEGNFATEGPIIKGETNVNTKPYASTTKGKSTIAAVSSSAIVATGIIIEKTAIIVGGAAIAIGGLVLITILEKNNKNKK